MQAVRIIIDEHRALTAVLRGMLSVLCHIRYGIAQPDFELLAAMLYYLRAFPERFHHPKEDAHLFPVVRERNASIADVLDRLQREHKLGTVKLDNMEQALARYRENGPSAFAAFHACVADYATFHYAHARLEESEVLPVATEWLTASDWQQIDEAFTAHTNPLLGAEACEEYGELFRRIVALTPAPMGAAPEPGAICTPRGDAAVRPSTS